MTDNNTEAVAQPTASVLADELVKQVARINGERSGAFVSTTRLADLGLITKANLPEILSALRRVEVMEKALNRIANAKPDDLLDEANTGILMRAIKIARQALTGEA